MKTPAFIVRSLESRSALAPITRVHGWGYNHRATGLQPPRGHVGYEDADLAADAFLDHIAGLHKKTRPS